MSSDTLCFTLLVLTSNDEFTATAPAADKVARSLVKMETVFYHYPMTERMGANIHQLFLFSAVGAPNIFVFTDFHYSPHWSLHYRTGTKGLAKTCRQRKHIDYFTLISSGMTDRADAAMLASTGVVCYGSLGGSNSPRILEKVGSGIG